MFQLNDLQNITDIVKIKAMLVPKEHGNFEVYVPKSTREYFSDPSAIAMDYALLAFAGQKLQEVAGSLSYVFISPDLHESVPFIVGDADAEDLANVLLELSYYYGFNDYGDDEEFSYMDIDQFVSDVNSGFIEAACPDFVAVSNEFFRRDEGEENDE